MNNKKLTMADFNEEIHMKFEQKREQIHIDGLKDYSKTFDIDLFCKEFFKDPNGESLNSDREIKQNLITFFKPKRIETLVYRYDYYTNKIEDKFNVSDLHQNRRKYKPCEMTYLKL